MADKVLVKSFVIVLLIQSSFSLSIRRNSNKENKIPSDEIDLWFGDSFPDSPAVFSASSSSASVSSSSSESGSSVSAPKANEPDESEASELTEKTKEIRPVIVLKNTSEAIPFTRIDATLIVDGAKTKDSDKVEEGVGPAVSFDYDSEFTGSAVEGDLSSGPESNYFDSGDLKIEISDIKPVYVKPPTGFRPIFYPNREMDGVAAAAASPESSASSEAPVTLAPPVEPYPYPYPFGLASWTLGGIRGIQRGGFWESLGNDASLGLPSSRRGNPVSIFEWINLGSKDESSSSTNFYKPPLPPPSSSSPISSSSFTTKNPVSLGSWMFGGIKDIPPFWSFPPMVIEKIEVVPMTTSQSTSSSSLSSLSSASQSLPESANSYWFISDNNSNISE